MEHFCFTLAINAFSDGLRNAAVLAATGFSCTSARLTWRQGRAAGNVAARDARACVALRAYGARYKKGDGRVTATWAAWRAGAAAYHGMGIQHFFALHS
jgi:hypothetical protein